MTRSLTAAAEAFDPRGLGLSAARSLLAIAELTVLAASPESLLFGSTPSSPPDQLCSGIGAVTLWCAGSSQPNVAQLAALMILGAVIAGLWPRWLCIPHWYVAFSMATRMVVLNGGDEIAQILTLLLIPACLGDNRWCHWTRPDRPMLPVWHGSSFAASLLLRCQAAIVYFDAALSKLGFSAWRSGHAVPILLNDPQFGLPPQVRGIAERVLAPGAVGTAVTWSVLVIECSIGASMLLGVRARRTGLVLGVCLHVSIIIAMGLFSFGLSMVALLTAVSDCGFRTGSPAALSPAPPAEPGGAGRGRVNHLMPSSAVPAPAASARAKKG